MTPQEFEQNAQIVSGDPNWTLDDSMESRAAELEVTVDELERIERGCAS